MFDIGAQEVLIIVLVAIFVIGPKEMPTALRSAGRWIGKLRRLSGHFRTGIDAMVREAEMEDMEKKWKAQNERIMRQHPEGEMTEIERTGAYPASNKPVPPAPAPASAESAAPAAATETGEKEGK